VNYLSAKELRESGLLQEVNREFLHPLGLAAEVDLETGVIRIQDHRDDPDGVIFGAGVLDTAKYERFRTFQEQRHAARREALGFVLQPCKRGT
jgi:hypothetical protein